MKPPLNPHIHFVHGDPADRFLAASAKFCDLTLATADELVRAARNSRMSNE